MINANDLIGTHDVLFVTLDTLRLDVAQDALAAGETPGIGRYLPATGWEARHTPGSFTYAAHHAFFTGFLPTPIAPGSHPRLFATHFPESASTTERTYVFDAPDIVTGFAGIGYHTLCIGGVNFFDKQSPLGSTLPNLFAESHWSAETGIDAPDSTEHQVDLALARLHALPDSRRMFLFINISAIHQPNYFYVPGQGPRDTLASHRAALRYVDGHLPRLLAGLHGPTLIILCSDHGTTYGEDGYTGHRIGHPVVWQVPYAEFVLPQLLY